MGIARRDDVGGALAHATLRVRVPRRSRSGRRGLHRVQGIFLDIGEDDVYADFGGDMEESAPGAGPAPLVTAVLVVKSIMRVCPGGKRGRRELRHWHCLQPSRRRRRHTHRRPCEGRGSGSSREQASRRTESWIPDFAGMTV